MTDENAPVLDLLGDPWQEPKDPRGRKAHKRSPEIAEFVAVSKATAGKDATDEWIAERVGLSVPTLKKYYFPELSGGVSMARRALIGVMWRKAMSGNVGAVKWLDEKLAKGELEEFIRAQQGEAGSDKTDGSAPAPAAPPTSRRMGKKEARAAAAQTAGEDGEWGDDLRFPRH